MQTMAGSIRFWVAFSDFVEDVAFSFLFRWMVRHIKGLMEPEFEKFKAVFEC